MQQRRGKRRRSTNSWRLQLRQKDQGYFEKHVRTRWATNALPAADGLSGAKIQNAATIRTRLVQMGEEKRSALLRFLLQSCYLVVVEVPTPTAARRIFTVLNARGIDLAATDTLKADQGLASGYPHDGSKPLKCDRNPFARSLRGAISMINQVA